MWNEAIDFARLHAISLQQFLANIRHLSNGKLEDRLPVLLNVMHLLVYGFVRRWMQAASARHVKRTSSRAVDLMYEVDNS